MTGIKPLEVCHNDASASPVRSRQGFPQCKRCRFFFALVACACGGIAKNHDDARLRHRLRSEISGLDDGDGEPSTANVRAGEFVAIHGDGEREFEHSRDVERERNCGRIGALGTISTSGNYTAPATLPNPNALTITATSAATTTASGSSAVTILNPTPTLVGTNPASTGTGSFFDHADRHEFYLGRAGDARGTRR